MNAPHATTALILTSLVALASAAASPAGAAWSTDPAVNLAIADRPSEQVIPKIAATADGGAYVGWFDLSPGHYCVYLERLDPLGNELWPHNGILVSDHPQSTSLVDWDLIVDSAGHCVLVFTDTRAGSDLDVYAYRVSPDGAMEWGADGITLSANADYEPSPKLCEASDGDFVFIWARLPSSGAGSIRMQRVAPDGTVRFAADGLPVVTGPGTEAPGFCELVPSAGGDVIVSWLRDISGLYTLRYLIAQRFNAAGAGVWAAPVTVFDATSIPIAYQPEMLVDGAGGAILGWHRSLSNLYNSCAQHLAASGAELWPHNGVTVSGDATRHHLDPTFAYDPANGDVYVFWNERNSLQSRWGIYGQKITAAGARAWGDQGIAYLPVDTIYKFLPRCLFAPAGTLAKGAMVFYCDEPTGLFNRDRLRGFRVDAHGAPLWAGSPIGVATTLSSRVHTELDATPSGSALLVWEDDRNGTPDVYGQNVNPDGSLGPVATSVAGGAGAGAPGAARGAATALLSRPNPFADHTVIELPPLAAAAPRGVAGGVASGGADDARLEIVDAGGRRVLAMAVDAAARARGHVAWDGRDDGGHVLPGGVYFYRVTAGGASGSGSVVIAR